MEANLSNMGDVEFDYLLIATIYNLEHPAAG